MNERPTIPATALAGMENWAIAVAWSNSPDVTTYRLVSPDGEARFLKVSRLGQEQSLAAERDRTTWAASYLPVPQVLNYGADATHEWLLTAELPGANATDDRLRAEPTRLVPLLADGLRQFHSLPVGDCPFDSRVDTLLPIAQDRVARGLVDVDRDLHRDHGALTADEALARLSQLRLLREDLVVCHGDYCFPNVLVRDWQVCGYVDLGRLGVADRWWDLAIATWSVTWNLGPGWEDLFLEAYGVRRDPDKIAFYRLLYDLLP